jgi:predicted dehydrogenase
VRATWDTAAALEAWQIPFPPDASPESIDFTTFLGPAAQRAFDLSRFFRWRCYRDYGSGLAGTRLAPQLTAIHWLLDLGVPTQVTATGALQRWKDEREVPDVIHATLQYGNGVTVLLGATQNGGSTRELRVIGTDATLTIGDAGLTVRDHADAEPYADIGETWSKEYRDWFYMMHGMSAQGLVRGAPQPERALERYAQPDGAATAAAHLVDFVECVRSRRAPAEPLALGRTVAEITRQIAAGIPTGDREARR